ncbi:MAG: NAD-binding protein [Dehalococcoidia bacterium]|nr:NAD-binding protein [Dehalococcoidia bacterium]
MTPIGFIGLGNMGGPMSAHLAAAGHELLVYDAAGTAERAPAGARHAASVADVAAEAEPVFLSLPDGPAVIGVCQAIVAVSERATRTVVDLSTVGIAAAEEAARRLRTAGIEYVDSPVSGGVRGAREATLAVMSAGDPEALARVEPLLQLLGSNRFVVGTEPGQAQAMKLLNNFLSAVATLATSEAIRFGERRGLEMGLMLDVLNASSGRNRATEDKFPRCVLTGTFDNGFTANLLAKDVGLYYHAAREIESPASVAETVSRVWEAMAAEAPGADTTRMYEFVEREP